MAPFQEGRFGAAPLCLTTYLAMTFAVLRRPAPTVSNAARGIEQLHVHAAARTFHGGVFPRATL